MKIALCTETVWPVYGVEKRVVEMARRLGKYGYEPVIYSSSAPENLPDLEMVQVSSPTIIKPPKRSYSACLGFWKNMFSKLRQNNIDLIDANGHLSLVPCSLAGLAVKKPVVATIHDLYLTEFNNMIGGFTSFFGGVPFEIISAKMPYAKLLTLNTTIKAKMSKIGARAEIVPSGIDVQELKRMKNVKKDRKKVIYVGRLTGQKRVDVLIKAFAKFDDEYELVIIGEGDQRNNLENLSKSIGLKNVSFAGRIENDEKVKELIKSSCALVMPSQRECFGIVPLEAMALGTCVISTATDGPKDYIIPGRNGFLTEINNIADLQQKMETLLNDQNLQKKFEKEGRLTANRYDWNLTVKRIARIYDEILKQ
ncbi:MAG: glycosyltransferase family 4 protein [Candidatus Aenigmarchaeota archaeon]|nr:glycosyltransferase family 4 protein [Candidatus Aenigmarchaeota archaeon]